MNKYYNESLVLARLLMSFLFLYAGYGKIIGYTATAGYMDSMGVPGFLLPLVILLEMGGGLGILFGFLTRFSAISISAFSILSALLFHNDFATGDNFMMLMKDFNIAGGFLILAFTGAGKYSIDSYINSKKIK